MKPWTWIILLGILLSACNQTASAPTSTPMTAIKEDPISTIQPSPTPSPTPIPPTETPLATVTTVPSPTLTPTPEDYGPVDFPEDVNPLTGNRVDAKLLDRRPVAFKIQIFPRGQRPTFDVRKADIVYDYYQNDGLTRFHAIFYANDSEQVGPIRSARKLDRTLVEMYESIFVFGGADRRVFNHLLYSESSDRLVLEGPSNPSMWRIEPNSYNYLVADTTAVRTYAEEKNVDNSRQELDGMSFQFEPPESDKIATQVDVYYSISAYTRWIYDPDTGTYQRWQDDKEAPEEQYDKFYDYDTEQQVEEQVTADNVVVLFVEHVFTRAGNSEIVDIQLKGEGQAFAFRDGQAYDDLTWISEPDQSVLNLTDPEGNPYPFKHGTTWFQVIDINSKNIAEDNDEGIWRFEFR